MNIKVILGIIAAIAILVIGFFLLRPKTASAPFPASPVEQNVIASTTPETSQPQQTKSNVGTTTSALKITALIARFDAVSFFSTSTYPIISGIANTPKVGIVINGSNGKGIVGTSEIPVTRGHWSYLTSVALVPGTYTLVLFIGNTITEIAKLIVNTP